MSSDLITDIMHAAAETYSITVESITGPSRCAYLVRARTAAMIAARALRRGDAPRFSYAQLGWRFNRDHSTIIHACDKAEVDDVLKREAFALLTSVREKRQKEKAAAVDKFRRERAHPHRKSALDRAGL